MEIMWQIFLKVTMPIRAVLYTLYGKTFITTYCNTVPFLAKPSLFGLTDDSHRCCVLQNIGMESSLPD